MQQRHPLIKNKVTIPEYIIFMLNVSKAEGAKNTKMTESIRSQNQGS